MTKVEDLSPSEMEEYLEMRKAHCRQCLGVHVDCTDAMCLAIQDDLFRRIRQKRGNMQRFPIKNDFK